MKTIEKIRHCKRELVLKDPK